MRLLKNEGYSIAGARKILELKHKRGVSLPEGVNQPVSDEVAQKIVDIIKAQFHMAPVEEKSAVA